MSIFVQLLGTVGIRRDHRGAADSPDGIADRDTTTVGSPKRAALLATLALSANRSVSLGTLADVLWGPAAPSSATMNLRSHVHALRHLVGRRLVTRAGAYELALEPDELDVALFLTLADRGAAAHGQGRLLDAVAAYGEALALWRGGVALSGVPQAPQLVAAAAGLLERRHAAFEGYCEARLGAGAASELVPGLRRHLAVHPFRERAWATLMLAQYRSGDVPGALGSYRHALGSFRDQLGMDPGQDLAELHRAVLSRDPRLDHPVGSGFRSPPDRPAWTLYSLLAVD